MGHNTEKSVFAHVSVPANCIALLKNNTQQQEMKPSDSTLDAQMFKKMDVNAFISKSPRELDLEKRIQETYRLLTELVENSASTSEETHYIRALDILCEQCQLQPVNAVIFKA